MNRVYDGVRFSTFFRQMCRYIATEACKTASKMEKGVAVYGLKGGVEPEEVEFAVGDIYVLPIFSCFVLGSLNEPLEKTRMYSWMSRRQGFDADCQDPHAVLAPADADLSQITSPRMRKPNSIIIVFT